MFHLLLHIGAPSYPLQYRHVSLDTNDGNDYRRYVGAREWACLCVCLYMHARASERTGVCCLFIAATASNACTQSPPGPFLIRFFLLLL